MSTFEEYFQTEAGVVLDVWRPDMRSEIFRSFRF